MTAPQDYNQLLHHLKISDIPAGQQHQRLNQLIRTIVEQNDANGTISSIQPVDFWSRKIRLDIAEAFHLPYTILDFLESDGKVLTNRILTFDWLFKDDSVLTDPKYLINDLFPRISCLCRQKLIRRLSNHLEDEQKCEIIFEAVQAEHGIDSAQCLLPLCGSEYISTILSTKKIQLTNRQLLLIFNKFPKIGATYLETFFRSKQCKESALWTSYTYNTSTDFYNRTLIFLAGEDCLQFMNIYEEFSEIISGLGVSTRAANRLVKFDVERIIRKPKVYANILNKDFLQKRLKSDQFETFFTGILPDVIQHFRRNISDILLWLTTFSRSRKGEILKLGFEKAYSQQLTDRIDCIASDIVQYLSPEERGKIVEHKLSHGTSDDTENIDYYESSPKHYEGFWTAFKPTVNSIPHLQELLSAESDSSLRSELIVQLVRTCAINEDKTSLGEVCKYVVNRHRNENIQVHIDFLESVDQNFELMELSGAHWDSLKEVIQLCLVAGDISRYSFVLNDILEKAFIHFTKYNIPVKSILPALIQMKTEICWGSNWRMETLKRIEYKSFHKKFIQMAAEEIESKYSAEDSYHDPTKRKSILALANCIVEWNNSCGLQEKLSFKSFPWLLERLVEFLDSDDSTDVTSTCQLLLSDPSLEKREYMDLMLNVNPTEPTLLYFLKHDPKKVSDKIDTLLKYILKTNVKLYKWLLRCIRCYGPATLTSQIISLCKAIAQDPVAGSTARGNSITVLSNLQNSSEFLKFIPQFCPTGSKLELDIEDADTNLHLARFTIASLTNIELPSQGLPILLPFCSGDYLKYSLGSLYSLCLNSSVDKTLPFLNQLVDRPVSVKKHGIRLMCLLSTREQVSTFMLKLWDAESNATIRQEIMKQTFKIIANESSADSTWSMLKSAIASLSAKDKYCLSEISKIENVEKIPNVFLGEYFLLCKKVYSQDKIDKTLKINLLQAVGRNRYRLSKEFFENLVEAELFSRDQENQAQQQLILLTISYLLSAPISAQYSCLDIIEKNFSKLIGPNWNAIYYGQSGRTHNGRKFFNFFIENLCTVSLDKLYERDNFVEMFRQVQRSEFFKKYKAETFGEHVFVEFALIFHSLGENRADLEAIGVRIGDLLDTFVSEHGKEIIGLFTKLLQAFLRQCCKSRCSSTEQTLQLIGGLLRPTSTGSHSTPRKLIASQLFPSTCPHGNVEESYKNLANELLKCPETVVHMYAYNCLKL